MRSEADQQQQTQFFMSTNGHSYQIIHSNNFWVSSYIPDKQIERSIQAKIIFNKAFHVYIFLT